jgi:VIT1/CCC1 family predicted Fe2+/Mn2+ transporter
MDCTSEKKSKDANTIRELAAEVKRLTSLVSRSMIEEDESLAPGTSLKETSSVDSVDDNTTVTDSNNASQKSILIVRGFSFLFVALAFLIGVLLVLVPLIIRHPELSLW